MRDLQIWNQLIKRVLTGDKTYEYGIIIII